VNSDRLKVESLGDEDDDDVGDGGPRAEAGTKSWGDGMEEVVEYGVDSMDREGVGEERLWEEKRLVRTESGDMGGVGGNEGTSREKRFVELTDKPLSCKARIRSAIEPPGFTIGPSYSSVPLVLAAGVMN
jgi:hypothetical protein